MIFGYLDPVTGSAILQVLLGALAVLGLGWQYVRQAFRTIFKRDVAVDEKTPEEVSG